MNYFDEEKTVAPASGDEGGNAQPQPSEGGASQPSEGDKSGEQPKAE